jgi:hypothetical protein
MSIETTLNLTRDDKRALKETAYMLGITVSMLVSRLMNRVLHEKYAGKLFSRVKYQKRREKGELTKLHICLRPDAYEGFIDLRKVLKLSVSFVVSIAIKKFLIEIIDASINDKNTDKYSLPYFYIVKNFDGIHYFLLIRGIPAQKHLERLLL